MELRKNVKRPHRYEPELLAHLDPTYVPRSTRPAFHIDYIDFNPALPPAKFPTLKYPKPSEHSKYQTRGSGSHISSLGRQAVTNQQLLPDQSQEGLDVPYDATDRWEGKDEVQDQVLVGSIQQFHNPKGDEREKWAYEGLEISDDEGKKGVKGRLYVEPRWKSLPVPLQLTIVDSMSTQTNLDAVFERLRLTAREQNTVRTQQWLRGQRGRREAASIEKMHTEQLHLLLQGQHYGLDAITRSEFCKTHEDHLYTHINVQQDYHTITKKDLADAQNFLRRISLDPDLAGEWSEIEDQHLANESQSVAVPATAGRSAGPRLKLRISMPREVPQQPFAVAEHQATALAKGVKRSTATMPVKRVLFADKALGPKNVGVAAVPTSELEFTSIRVLPPSRHKRKSRYQEHEVEMKDSAVKVEQALSR